ncbi:MAG: hypothetical protein WDN48_10270 [Pseudolabrys sp.]
MALLAAPPAAGFLLSKQNFLRRDYTALFVVFTGMIGQDHAQAGQPRSVWRRGRFGPF